MKRFAVSLLSVFFLLVPATLFADHDTARAIVRDANRTAREIVRDANSTASEVVRDSTGHLHFRGYQLPRYHHSPSVSVTVEAGVVYEPYYGPYYHREVVVAPINPCGLADLFTLGLLDACGRKAAVAATERVALEQIRAGVVTGTMGKEGAVLYSSPNGPTELRASRDPSFSAE